MVTAFVAALIIGTVYFVYTGNPFDKKTFEKKVAIYVQQKYPELVVDKTSTFYDFKQGIYYSTLKINSGLMFSIHPNYDGSLRDDYYQSVLENKLTKQINELVGNYSNAKFIVEAKSDELEKMKNQSSYSELPLSIKSQTKLFIYYNEKFKVSEETFNKCFQVIDWLKKRDIICNVVFFYNNKAEISVHYNDLDLISDWTYIKNYVSKASS